MYLAAGLIAGLLGIIMVIPYVRDILARKTRPHRASWLIWTSLGLIATFSQLAKGATNSLWMTVAQTIATAVVFLLSIKFGEGGYSKRDRALLLLAFLGLLAWFFTKNAAYALFITIGVDAIGASLTAVKAYRDPMSETLATWILSAISGILGTVAVGQIDFILMAYPFYVFLANLCVIVGIVLGTKREASRITTQA